MLRELLSPVLRWPLQSPSRFYGTIAVLVLVVLAIFVVNNQKNADAAPATDATPSAETTASTDTATTPTPSAVAEPEGGDKIARDFVQKWATPGDKTAWQKSLDPLVTQQLAGGLAMTDSEKIEKLTVTGTQFHAEHSGTETALYTVFTTEKHIDVTLTREGDQWLVSDFDTAADAG